MASQGLQAVLSNSSASETNWLLGSGMEPSQELDLDGTGDSMWKGVPETTGGGTPCGLNEDELTGLAWKGSSTGLEQKLQVVWPVVLRGHSFKVEVLVAVPGRGCRCRDQA